MPQKKTLSNLVPVSTLALALSTVLSLWTFISGPSINTDGVIYLKTARGFIDAGFSGALQVYGWPFYSMLIAAVAQLGVTLDTAAALINVLLFAALAWAFVAVVELLYPKQKNIHYLASAIILLEPYLNSLRGSFFRDSGHLAFTLTSLVALLQYANTRRIGLLVTWVLATLVATLFRPEAVLLLPAGIIALAYHRPSWKFGALAIAFTICCAVILFLMQRYAPTSRIIDVIGWWNFYSSDFGNTFSRKAALLERTVLGDFSDNGRESLLAALVVTVIAAVVGVITPIYAVVLWVRRKNIFISSPIHKKIIWAYAIAALIPSLLFVAFAYFLSQRYVTAFALILLLLVPQLLIDIFYSMRNRAARISFAVLLVLIFSVASYRNLRSETELKDAGVWLANQSGSVWTNSIPINYYLESKNPDRALVIKDQSMAKSSMEAIDTEWVALVIARRDQAKVPLILEQLHGVEQKRFDGSGRFVIIIKR
ncbi:MAG: hypothetical protein JWM78_351 [Verrucomicrobiaceae bacterium]|nr:hypothetical protein [Verrucomicrobiaceae bacterium]